MKSFWKSKIIFFLLLPFDTLQISNRASLSYIGAVAEYKPVRTTVEGKNPSESNVKNYLKFIKKASEFSADILVFPESSLSITNSKKHPEVSRSDAASYIPDPKDKIVPCDYNDDTKFTHSLRAISCAARDHNMYLVINHHEKVDCLQDDDDDDDGEIDKKKSTTACPRDKLLIYNTNVAFDRHGMVIARYRKYNLFGEPGVNKTKANSDIISVFSTDFGVDFGQFVCFDLLFSVPALNLTKQFGITDIVFSNHWFSELPFLFSVQAQAGWSFVNDVNLLSSGYNDPLTISGGSGIYMGRDGYSHVVMESKSANVLVVAEIPKVIAGQRRLNLKKSRVYVFNETEIDTIKTINDDESYEPLVDDLKVYTTKLIDIRRFDTINETLCNRGFCCDFKLKLSFEFGNVEDSNSTSYYRYRIVVFNGTRSFSGVAKGGIQTCGLISCVDDTLNGCGRLSRDSKLVWPTTFRFIEITSRVNDIDQMNALFMPVGIDKNFIPLNVTDYNFVSYDDDFEKGYNVMTLTKARNDLLTFAIFGRNFLADNDDVTRN